MTKVMEIYMAVKFCRENTISMDINWERLVICHFFVYLMNFFSGLVGYFY